MRDKDYLRENISEMIEESSYDNLAVHLFPNNSKQSMRESLINLERKDSREGSKKMLQMILWIPSFYIHALRKL